MFCAVSENNVGRGHADTHRRQRGATNAVSDAATPRCHQADSALDASAVDERRELTIEEADRLVAGFQAIGRPGTAGDLALVIQSARNTVRAALRGFVALNNRGKLCFFAHAMADGIELEGELLVAAQNAAPWSVARHQLPGAT